MIAIRRVTLGWPLFTTRVAVGKFRMYKRSKYEQIFETQLRHLGLPAPTIEHVFAPPRRWRFDCAWPDKMIAVEIDGMGVTGVGLKAMGRHQRPAGAAKDNVKSNEATRLGWRVYRFTGRQVKSGEAVNFIEGVLATS